MTQTGDLEELQPLDEGAASAPGAPQPPSVAEATLMVLRSGLPTPAFNPRAEKPFYRFLFAGVVMLLGCMMPFGPEWEMAGYKTISGALFTLISLGIVWSWWSAIHTTRFTLANLKWVLFALIPFVVELMNLIRAFDEPAVKDWIAQKGPTMPKDWADLMESLKGFRDPTNGEKIGNFVRAFGSGKIVLMFGALLAEIFLVSAVMGGVKAGKAQKAAASERRKR
ncbi:MAG: hypothetical protein IT458_04335 [Planctomycetes bacterium]|nr:hypothetical protein [Planctomycetota bacterium]